jgi:hypothetical protein
VTESTTSGPVASMWLEFMVGQDGSPEKITVASYRGPEAGKLAIEKAAIDGVRAYYRSARPPGTIVRLPIELPLSDSPRPAANQLPDPTSPSVTPPAGAGGAPSVAADH